MLDDPRAITFIGTTDFRNSNTPFGIRAKDRLRHMYIIGSTGVGKSFLIENLLIQDIKNGNGVALLDPHGTTAEKILKFIPEHRIKDVVYFAPHDLDFPVGFNPLEDPGRDYRSQVADGLLTAFKKIWVDAFSGRMEYIFSNVLLALLEYPGSTLLSVNRMMSDKNFREKVVANVKDPSVKSVWVDEFMKWEDRFAREAFSSIQNKVGQFTANPMIRNILGQPKSTLDFRHMMDTRKIFIANLSKGRVGEQNAPLIGAMLITKIYLAAMSRADKSEYEMNFLPPFYLYVDEFQNFANDSFENILSESRKYKLGLVVAHQYVAQMPEKIQDAVFGNVGTKIVFRTQKPEDAEIFEKVFTPVFTATDIMNLGLAQIYLSLLIDGVIATPFSARTIRQDAPPAITFEHEIIQASREKYTRTRADVEEEISQWFVTGADKEPSKGKSDPQQGSKQSEPSSSNSARTKEHQDYLAQKKKEIEDKGGVWLDPDEYKSAKQAGSLEDLIQQKKKEKQKEKQQQNINVTKNTSKELDDINTYEVKKSQDRKREEYKERSKVLRDERSPRNRRDTRIEDPQDTDPRPDKTKHSNASSDETRNNLKSLLASISKESNSNSNDKSSSTERKNDNNNQNQNKSQNKPNTSNSQNTPNAKPENNHNIPAKQNNNSRDASKQSKDQNNQHKSENNNQLNQNTTKNTQQEYDSNRASDTNQNQTANQNTTIVTKAEDTQPISKRWSEIDPADLAKALGITL